MSTERVAPQEVDTDTKAAAPTSEDLKLKAAMIMMGTDMAFEMIEEEEENERG